MACWWKTITILVIFCTTNRAEEDRFFWENDHVGKPVNFYHGAAYQIPVIKGEIVEIQCKVRAVSEDPYTIIWDYENFHAITTGMTVLVNNTDGDDVLFFFFISATAEPHRLRGKFKRPTVCTWGQT